MYNIDSICKDNLKTNIVSLEQWKSIDFNYFLLNYSKQSVRLGPNQLIRFAYFCLLESISGQNVSSCSIRFSLANRVVKIPPWNKKSLEKKDLELIFLSQKTFVPFFSEKGIGDKTKKAKKHQKEKKFFPLLSEN